MANANVQVHVVVDSVDELKVVSITVRALLDQGRE